MKREMIIMKNNDLKIIYGIYLRLTQSYGVVILN